MKKFNWMVLALCVAFGLSGAVSCSNKSGDSASNRASDSSASQAGADKAADKADKGADGKDELRLSTGNSVSLGAGSSAFSTITFIVGGQPASGLKLYISARGENGEDCASVTDASGAEIDSAEGVTTDSKGEAKIKITAGSKTCSGSVDIMGLYKGGLALESSIAVKVSGNADSGE